jgi:hypothetical protein
MFGADPIPTPIGVGPRFHPPAATHAVVRGEPVGPFRCGAGGRRFGVHLEVFARGRVVIVPAGIGVARRRGCSYIVRTLEPTGVIEVRRGSQLTLGDFFRVWGQPLSTIRLVGFRTNGSAPVRAYVAGRRWRGSARSIPLRRHAQIVLELGTFIPPHRAFLFRPGL